MQRSDERNQKSLSENTIGEVIKSDEGPFAPSIADWSMARRRKMAAGRGFVAASGILFSGYLRGIYFVPRLHPVNRYRKHRVAQGSADDQWTTHRQDVAIADVSGEINGFPKTPPAGVPVGADGVLRFKLLLVPIEENDVWWITEYHNVAVTPGA